MSRHYKHQMRDKWEAHIPGKPAFIQNEYYSSLESENFHLTYGWKQHENQKHGTRFGVQRRLSRASGCGVMVDGHHVGKAEE